MQTRSRRRTCASALSVETERSRPNWESVARSRSEARGFTRLERRGKLNFTNVISRFTLLKSISKCRACDIYTFLYIFLPTVPYRIYLGVQNQWARLRSIRIFRSPFQILKWSLRIASSKEHIHVQVSAFLLLGNGYYRASGVGRQRRFIISQLAAWPTYLGHPGLHRVITLGAQDEPTGFSYPVLISSSLEWTMKLVLCHP
jgi:hypothetical protein